MNAAFDLKAFRRAGSGLLVALMLGGCASAPTQKNSAAELGPYERLAQSNEESVVTHAEYNDPLQSINRAIFGFNHYTYRYLLTPVSRGYQAVIPEPVDKSVGNFFNNLREPLYSLNYLLQLEPKKLGKSLLRFGVNSTVGLLGLFDPADSWGLEKESSGFDETLAAYGAGYGTYIVVPLLGPSDMRGLADTAVNYFLHPLKHIENAEAGQALLIADGYHRQIGTLANYPKVIEDVEDPYIFVRNLYLQGVIRDADALQSQSPSETARPNEASSYDREDSGTFETGGER